MLRMTLSLTGKRRETISGFLRHIADTIDTTGEGLFEQTEDGEVIGALSGESIEYSMIGITDKGCRVVLQSGFTSRSHCFSSCTGAAVVLTDNNGTATDDDGKEHKVVRLVVEDNEGNTIFHRSPELWVK
jgi:hypothetical protein